MGLLIYNFLFNVACRKNEQAIAINKFQVLHKEYVNYL